MPLIDDDLFMQMQSEYFRIADEDRQPLLALFFAHIDDLLATLEALLESEDVGVAAWRDG